MATQNSASKSSAKSGDLNGFKSVPLPADGVGAPNPMAKAVAHLIERAEVGEPTALLSGGHESLDDARKAGSRAQAAGRSHPQGEKYSVRAKIAEAGEDVWDVTLFLVDRITRPRVSKTGDGSVAPVGEPVATGADVPVIPAQVVTPTAG